MLEELYIVLASIGGCLLFQMAWSLVGNLKGDTGPQGPAGVDGTNGTNGTNGADGPPVFSPFTWAYDDDTGEYRTNDGQAQTYMRD